MKRLSTVMILLAAFAITLSAAPKTAVKPAAPAENWWGKAVIYQVFVRSFHDSDGDGKGDFNGLTSKLDYIKGLGVNAVWLMPVFEAFQYHGYDITDFYSIEKDFGTMADFDNFMKEAKKRNIRVILDMVINHASKTGKWFMDSATNQGSPYKDWFIWTNVDLNNQGWLNASGARQPAWNSYLDIKTSYRYSNFYYSAFNGTIPDLNLKNPAVIAEVKKIAKFWLDRGVDGFRMDGARFMIEDGAGKQADTDTTRKFWADYCKYVHSVKPDAYVIAEIYAGMDLASTYYTGKGGLDASLCFDFGADSSIYMGMGGMKKSLDKLRENLNKLAAFTSKGLPADYFSIFLSSHDRGRFGEFVRDDAKAKLGAFIQFTMPGGAPVMYYGDEIGMRNGDIAIGDADKRNPMWWNETMFAGFSVSNKIWNRKMDKDIRFYTNGVNVAAMEKDPNSILSLYKKLIALRMNSPALYKGSYSEILMPAGNAELTACFSYIRVSGSQTALVLFNAGKTNAVVSAPLNAAVLKDGKWKVKDSLVSTDFTKPADKSITDALINDKAWKIELPAKGFVLVVLEK